MRTYLVCCLGLVITLAAWGQPEVRLRSGVAYPDGAENIFVAKKGDILLTRFAGGGSFTKWDVRTGYELSSLVRPDGQPFALSGRPRLAKDGQWLLLPDANAVRVLDMVTLEWVREFPFENAGALVWDEAKGRIIASRNQGRRNHLYTIDFADGTITEVARLRGADRSSTDPEFNSMQLATSGLLVGIDDHPTECTLIDPESWSTLQCRDLGAMDSLSLLPDGSLLGVDMNYSKAGHGGYDVMVTKMDPQSLEILQSIRVNVGGDIRTKLIADPTRNYDSATNRVLLQSKYGFIFLDLDRFEIESKVWGSELDSPFAEAMSGALDTARNRIYFFADGQLTAVDATSKQIVEHFGTRPVQGGVATLEGRSDAFGIGDRRVVSIRDLQVSVTDVAPESRWLGTTQDGLIKVSSIPGSSAVRLWDSRIKGGISQAFGTGLKQIAPTDKYLQERSLDPPLAVLSSDDGSRVAIMRGLVFGLYDVRAKDVPLFSFQTPRYQNVTRTVFEQAVMDGAGAHVVFKIKRSEVKPYGSPVTPGVPAAWVFMGYNDTGEQLFVTEVQPDTELLGWRDDTTFAVLDRARGHLKYLSFETGEVRKDIPIDFGRPTSSQTDEIPTTYTVSGDDAHVAVMKGRRVAVLQLDTGLATVKPFDLEQDGEECVLLNAGTVLMNRESDFAFYNTRSGDRFGQLTLFDQDGEWVFHQPNGRFDATIAAQDRMYFEKGDLVLPLVSLFRQTYTAGLFKAGYMAEALPPPDLTLVAEIPTAEISVVGQRQQSGVLAVTQASIKLQLSAESESSFIDEIRLFHNGKRVSVANRGLFVEDDTPDAAKEATTLELLLLPGENRLKVVAVDQLQLESRPVELVVNYQEGDAERSGGIRLHLLVVGVNEYVNPKYNLNYAVSDAKAFREAILQRNGGLFTGINEHLLTNAEVSRATIVEKLEQIARDSGPRDVFVFYYAGHGVMSQGETPEFYLLPPGITQIYGNDAELAREGVSAAVLQDLAKAIPAQKQVFLLDACHSAGALTTVTMRGASEERAIAMLARSTGTHWLTATGTDQFAAEFADLGHGAFTQAILEGLAGGADPGGDGQVSIRELDAFVQNRVPELTRQYRGAPQYPASFGYGQDFPLGVVQK